MDKIIERIICKSQYSLTREYNLARIQIINLDDVNVNYELIIDSQGDKYLKIGFAQFSYRKRFDFVKS